MTIRDQQFDEDGQYVARRDFVMGGQQYILGDRVPLSAARDPAHFRKLYVARLIRLADPMPKVNGFHPGDQIPLPGGSGPSIPMADAPAVTSVSAGADSLIEPNADPKKTEPERLPGGTTTRYIEHTGRGWFRIVWDGTETKARGAEAAQGVFSNLQAQESMQKGQTVFAKDAPEGAGGEAPREDPAHPAPWIEDGKDQTDLP